MIAINTPSRQTLSVQDQVNEQFLKLIPAIRRYAQFKFRISGRKIVMRLLATCWPMHSAPFGVWPN